jgi:hypothetical protein
MVAGAIETSHSNLGAQHYNGLPRYGQRPSRSTIKSAKTDQAEIVD